MPNNPKILAVIVHGLRANAEKMSDVTAAVAEEYGSDCITLTPNLPHKNLFSFARATTIVQTLLEKIDAAVKAIEENGTVAKIVLIGHSSGATLVRRAFLVATGKPEGFDYENGCGFDESPRPWVHLVERIVLLAAFNRGWQASERMGWYYSIGFNVAGLVGHILPGDISPMVFDLRLGAPFMVQTRLHWMAYRRSLPPHSPILIQIIGTQDDLIAPIDQVDIAVDGTHRALVGSPRAAHRQGGDRDNERNYFLLEAPGTNHKTITVFHGDDVAAEKVAGARKELFCEALALDRADLHLHKDAIDPGLLTDEVGTVDRTVNSVVFVIHGIRDDGFWTHRIAGCIRRVANDDAALAVRSWTPTYGYFAMLPFLLPWIRRQKVEWFMDQYVSALAQYPAARFHFVGHSNGTYLAARALEAYPAFRLNNVVFAGSVVRTNYDWIDKITRGQVERFQNIVASADKVVAWLPKSVEYWWKMDVGGAGFDGFQQSHPAISQLRYMRGGHGAGIKEEHWKQIAKFILTGTPLESDQTNTTLYAKRPDAWTSFVSEPRCMGGILLLLFLVFVPLSFVFLPWWYFGTCEPWWYFEWTAWRLFGLVIYILVLRFFITRF